MDINYRSHPEIITAAKNLNEHNTQQLQKDIHAARNGTGQVIFHSSPGRLEEIEYLAMESTQLRISGILLSSIAVLSRTNQELEDVAAVLESHHLEYNSPEPIRDIYEHFIFTDIMAYLNLIDGNFRSEDLIRILNKPGRYLKESAFRNVKKFTDTTSQWRNKENQKTGSERELRRKEIEKEFKEGAPASFWKWMGVHHKTFGSGTVIRKTLSFVIVRFEEGDKLFFLEPIEQ